MTRGEFISGAVAAIGLSGCSRPGQGSGAAYGVAILGDTHFDAAPESLYHSHYDESNRYAKVQHEEFRRNGEMWASRCRELLAASGRLAADRPTDFVLQLGDLIQGDCDDVATHQRMMDDCIRLFRAAYPQGLPFLTVLGNHDIRGKGARKAYLDFAEPYMTRELGLPARATYPAFAWRKGPDLWVFCDFETKDLQPIIDCLVEVPRYTFLVTHGPFTPCEDGFPAWRLGGSPACDSLRMKLYEILSRRHAIVLSGHTHRTAHFRHENAFGGFAEFTVNSVWQAPGLATDAPMAEGAAAYGKLAAKLPEKRRDEFCRGTEAFRTGLREYYMSLGAGHYRLSVSDAQVEMAFFPGAAEKAARRFVLR